MTARALLVATLLGSPLPGVAETPADPGPAAASAAPGSGAPIEQTAERLGLDLEQDAAWNISSDELEYRRGDDGRERVLFHRSVEATQGNLRILCEELEAIYPGQEGRAALSGGGGPERILARGSVRILQPGIELLCAAALVDRTAQRALCRGGTEGAPARLTRDRDVVTGREIEYDARTGTFKVRGGASVTVTPRAEEEAQ